MATDSSLQPLSRTRVLKVGHEAGGTGVEGVNDHFTFGRAGDLHAAILDDFGNGRHLPVGFADVTSFRKEVQLLPQAELMLDLRAR